MASTTNRVAKGCSAPETGKNDPIDFERVLAESFERSTVTTSGVAVTYNQALRNISLNSIEMKRGKLDVHKEEFCSFLEDLLPTQDGT